MDPTPAATAAKIGATAPAESDAAETGADAAKVASDFDTFLSLLTAQLRNQDPLSPVDSTKYVSQLASFSGVEQQVKMNDKLDALAETLGGGGAAGLARWIGVEARGPGAASFDGAPVEIAVEPDPEARFAALVVTDAAGETVAREIVDPEAAGLVWDGTAAGGEAAPPGRYSFAVEYSDGERALSTAPGEVFAAVTEARIEDGEQVLLLEGGAKVKASEVTAVR